MKNTREVFTYESQLLKDEEGYYYDFANVEFIDSDEYPTIYMEIEYAVLW